MSALDTTVVIPTLGRPSLQGLLQTLAGSRGPRPQAIVVVDDRPAGAGVEPLDLGLEVMVEVIVLRSAGRGPAAARNLGWRAARTAWVSFLDDDVLIGPDWLQRLAADLAEAPGDTVGSQGRVDVPLPAGRRPTDWERVTAGLATSQWITADMTYRRDALSMVGGFDERFRRAFREDADLALRVAARGGRLAHGRRYVAHPARPVDDWVSVHLQRGNADDVLMRRLHGSRWRELAAAPRGRRARHLAITAAAIGAVACAAAARCRRGLAGRAAVAAAGLWAAGTAEFAAARIAPGPRDADEVRRMLLTSVVIPPAATWHTLAGWWRHRGAGPWRGLPDLVLFDRDGTLVRDVPYNGEPARLEPLPRVRAALAELRGCGVRTGVVTNQSGIARGLLTPGQVDAVNAELDRLLGAFDVWQLCPHGPGDGCACRKPAPGLVKQACAAVGVDPVRCVVVGDVGSDVAAAEAAGAVGFLVPTAQTSPDEVRAARRVAPTLPAAIADILGGRW
ncbi:MAG: HAD-IIIA family hydrolase [Jiangellaceae bacterium]|nr:HAD-IIIA family hydrolase [Jiangellaceae bacterium]